jgi:prepilin-type N-terminal cleavage/methylation domain-containing protein
MDAAMMNRPDQPKRTRSQRGFSLLEVVISTAILTVGLVALLAVFAVAVSSTQSIQLDTIARQRASQALESIFTARASAQITFNQIQNAGGGGPGIFLSGMLPLTDPGPDGLEDTIDDVPPASIILPGPTGSVAGANPSTNTISLANFQRQVQINNTNDASLRQIIVTVQYLGANGKPRTYSVQALISSYR